MQHELEKKYGLTANELLDALNKRFRAKIALKGAVAEVQLEKQIKRLKEEGIISHYEEHDQDAYPDFTIKIKKSSNIYKIECKNVRDNKEAYREKGEIIAFKVETQKTRTSNADRSSRYYDFNYFDILAVCLGKKIGDWTRFMFIKAKDLEKHESYPNKLKVMHRVPLPDSKVILPWCNTLKDLVISLK